MTAGISDEREDTIVKDSELFFEQQNANDESGLPEELNDSLKVRYQNPPGLAFVEDMNGNKELIPKDPSNLLVRP